MTNGAYIKNDDFLVTKSVLDPKCPPGELWALFRGERTAGTLVVEFLGGVPRSIVLDEKTKATAEERVKIRDIMQMPS